MKYTEKKIKEIDKEIVNVIDCVVDSLEGKYNIKETRQKVNDAIFDSLNAIKDKRDIRDFQVVCDETNNPCDVVQSNNICVHVDWLDRIGKIKYYDRKFH